MKRYAWLLGVTAALSLALLLAGGAIESSRPQVTVTTLQRQTVAQTVACTGKVETQKSGTKAAAAGRGPGQVRVAVPESRLRRVQVGQRVTVSGKAFREEGYTGTVVALGESAYSTPAGGTVVDAVIRLDHTDPSLKCGLTAKASICVEESEGVLIPYDCLQKDGAGEFIYILENGRARRVSVSGTELSDGLLVTEGLPAEVPLIRAAEGEELSDGGAVVCR